MFPDGATKATIRQRTARAISRLRFTLMFLAAMLIANFASGSIGGDLPHEILEAWGIGHDSLLSGEAFRLLTGIFLSHDADMLLRQLVFAGAVIGHTEWRRGSLRAAVLFFGLDLAGTLILLALIGGAAGLGHLAGANDARATLFRDLLDMGAREADEIREKFPDIIQSGIEEPMYTTSF